MKLTPDNIEKEMNKAAKANKATVTEFCWGTAESVYVQLNNEKGVYIVLSFEGDDFQGLYVQVNRQVEVLDYDTDEPTGEFEHEEFEIDCKTLGEAVRKWRAA